MNQGKNYDILWDIFLPNECNFYALEVEIRKFLVVLSKGVEQ